MAKKATKKNKSNSVVFTKNLDGRVELVIESHKDEGSVSCKLWNTDSDIGFYAYGFHEDNSSEIKAAEAVIAALQQFIADAKELDSRDQ